MSDQEEPTCVKDVVEWLYTSIAPLILSAIITFSFMIGEILIHHNLSLSAQFMITTISDILAGPFMVIAFMHSDTFSTILFFLTIWHFLCDHSAVKASSIFVLPRCKDTFADKMHWMEAVMTSIHHFGVGALKLAVDIGVVDLSAKFGNVNSLLLMGFVVVCVGLIHLSFATQRLELAPRFSYYCMLFATALRIAGDAYLLHRLVGTCSPLVYWLTADLGYMVAIILVRIIHTYARKQTGESSEWDRRAFKRSVQRQSIHRATRAFRRLDSNAPQLSLSLEIHRPASATRIMYGINKPSTGDTGDTNGSEEEIIVQPKDDSDPDDV